MNIRTNLWSKIGVIRNDLRDWRVRRELAHSAETLLRKITSKKFKVQIPFWYRLKKLANYPVFVSKKSQIQFKRIRTRFALRMNLQRSFKHYRF